MSVPDYRILSIENLKELVDKGIPAEKRMAAIELYQRGEKDFAIKFLIKQMNLYKDPKTHENIKRETCMASAVILGRLKDKLAVEPLFEALGEISRCAAAYALAKINGPEIEERLLNIVGLETLKGIHAAIALGLMRNEKVVPNLIYLIEHKKEYEEKYKNNIAMELFDLHAFMILGTYKENRLAEKAFRKHLTKAGIKSILMGFISHEKYPQSYIFSNEMAWEIAKKYGWDKYFDTEEEKYVFTYTNPEKWVEDMRNEIVEIIWKEIKGDN
jgi:hypothetical protein